MTTLEDLTKVVRTARIESDKAETNVDDAIAQAVYAHLVAEEVKQQEALNVVHDDDCCAVYFNDPAECCCQGEQWTQSA